MEDLKKLLIEKEKGLFITDFTDYDDTNIPIKKQLEDLRVSLTAAHKLIACTQEENVRNAQLIEFLNQKIEDLYSKNQCLLEHVIRLDTNQRRQGLIFNGISLIENEGPEELKDMMLQLCKDYLYEKMEEADIDVADRVGKIDDRGQDILVQFSSITIRNIIYDKRENLKKINVFVNEDLPDILNERRETAEAVYLAAKKQDLECELAGDQVIVDGSVYDHATYHILPEEISLDKIHLVPIKGGLAFAGEHIFLSNLYPCKLHLNEINYQSVEHAFLYRKANFAGNFALASEIKDAISAREAQRVSQSLPESEEWNCISVGLMQFLLEEKIRQNPDLSEKLVMTGDYLLVAGTEDSKFGAGQSLHSGALKEGNWNGENLLGKMWMKLREVEKRGYSKEELDGLVVKGREYYKLDHIAEIDQTIPQAELTNRIAEMELNADEIQEFL